MIIDNNKVNLFYDLIDSALMTYYEDIKRDYLEAFVSFTDALMNGLDDSKLSEEAIEKLEQIIDQFEKEEFLNEEVRLASELIFIKGFKARNMNLDFLTPDAISYIFSFVCNSIIYNQYQGKEVTIMDTVIGTGNLLQTVINNSKVHIKGIGVEKEEIFALLAKSLAELMDNELVINYNDAKNKINAMADIIIGDFGESKEVYDIITSRTENIYDKGYFAYLINNDFFVNLPQGFKEKLTKEATLMGLIVLPQKFISKGHIGKSILIGKKEVMKDYQMSVVSIDDDLSEQNMEKVMKKINKMFE